MEAALRELGKGFLENPANTALRDALQTGALTRHGYFEMLLRLVYRLIFLFAAEDRNLLHSPDASAAARAAYRNGYSVGRLRERCTRSAALDQHHDVWNGLRAVFNALTDGTPQLGLAALGGLFSTNIAPLTDALITNRRMLKAIWHLSWFRSDGQLMTRVNWRDMQTEELGSVYESLLELIPIVHLETRAFIFTYGDAANKGNERKTTGTYYTPDSLVQLLLATTLDPLLDAAEARNPTDPAAEILKLSFIDPACGSGHFLLGAARRCCHPHCTSPLVRCAQPRMCSSTRSARSCHTAFSVLTAIPWPSNSAKLRCGSRCWNRASHSPSSMPASAVATVWSASSITACCVMAFRTRRSMR